MNDIVTVRQLVDRVGGRYVTLVGFSSCDLLFDLWEGSICEKYLDFNVYEISFNHKGIVLKV